MRIHRLAALIPVLLLLVLGASIARAQSDPIGSSYPWPSFFTPNSQDVNGWRYQFTGSGQQGSAVVRGIDAQGRISVLEFIPSTGPHAGLVTERYVLRYEGGAAVADIEFPQSGPGFTQFNVRVGTAGQFGLTFDEFKQLIEQQRKEAAAKEVQKEEVRDLTRSSSRTVERLLVGRTNEILLKNVPVQSAEADADKAKQVALAEALKDDAPSYAIKTGAKKPATGLSAGAEQKKFGTWVNGAWTVLGNAKDGADYAGSLVTTLAGMDYKVLNNLVFGAAGGFEYSNLWQYPTKSAAAAAGFTLSPYIAYSPFALDWTQTMLDFAAAFTFTGNYVDIDRGGNYPSFRAMLSANAAQHFFVDAWRFKAGVGYMWADTTVYSDRFKGASIGDFKVEGKVGYMFLDRIEPYLNVAYLYDTLANADVDPDEVEGTLGVNVKASDAFNVSFETANTFFRDHVYNTRFMLNLRYEF